jgi:L-ascorbate metabolism protein UlaG (beta-lactamase superfamily)
MNITYFGHSCFLVEINGVKLLFDPFITPNTLASSVSVETIEADYILLSHGHQDHMYDALAIAKRTGAKLIGIWEIAEWALKNGVADVHHMNIGGKWQFDFGRVQMVQAVHSSSFPDGSYAGAPAGFVVQAGGQTFYYAGDTALYSDMKYIGAKYNIDVAFLPIGSNFTMDLEDALTAASYVGATQVIGMHYDTFPYIAIEHQATLNLAKENNIELTLMEIGQTISM